MDFIKTYPSGLRLTVKRTDGLFSVSSGIFVSAGSRNEDEKNNGISHFIEHTTFKGTPTLSAFDISDRIDRIGSQINAFTSKETTVYYVKSTAAHFRDTFAVLADIFLHSEYKAEELEKEKDVIVEEINMTEDTPDEVCLDLLSVAFHGEKGLGRTILGPAENVKAFTREDVFSYKKRRYTPENIVISIAGAVDPEDAARAVEEYFGELIDAKPQKGGEEENFTETRTDSLFKIKDTSQAHVALAIPFFPYGDERSDAGNLAANVLGGTMSSRLFQRVREELGLCYTVYAYPSQYRETGKIEVYAAVSPSKREEAVKRIAEEIAKFQKNGMTKAEFEKGKEQMKSSFIMSLESTSAQMQIYGKHLLCLGKPFDLDEKIAAIDRLSAGEVNKYVKTLFDLNKAALATVGTTDRPIDKNAILL